MRQQFLQLLTGSGQVKNRKREWLCTPLQMWELPCDNGWEWVKHFSEWHCLLVKGCEWPPNQDLSAHCFTHRENKAVCRSQPFTALLPVLLYSLENFRLNSFFAQGQLCLFGWLFFCLFLCLTFCFFFVLFCCIVFCQKRKQALWFMCYLLVPMATFFKFSRTKLSSNHYNCQLQMHFYRNYKEGSW